MTLPNERTRAVLETAKTIAKLAPYFHRARGETVRVPTDLLLELLLLQRHYPGEFDIAQSAVAAPHVWENPYGEEA